MPKFKYYTETIEGSPMGEGRLYRLGQQGFELITCVVRNVEVPFTGPDGYATLGKTTHYMYYFKKHKPTWREVVTDLLNAAGA